MPRIELGGDSAILVTPTGDDALGGLCVPFRRPQAAWDWAFANLDLCGYRLTIQLEPGTDVAPNIYEGLSCSGRLVGQAGSAHSLEVGFVGGAMRPGYKISRFAPVTIAGDIAHPGRVLIKPPANSGQPGLGLSECASLRLEGVAIDTFDALADCIDVFWGAFLSFSNICVMHAGFYSNHFSVADATIYQTGGYDIAGSAAYHINLGGNSTWLPNNNGDPQIRILVNVLSPCTFQDFVLVDKGIFYCIALSYVGPAISQVSCRTCTVMRNGVIETANNANPNVFPGSPGPLLLSGGLYL